MKITLEEAKRVAALASLEFEHDSLARTAREMSEILDYVDQLSSVDVSRVEVGEGPVRSVQRADESCESTLVEAVRANAPKMLHDHFVVPRVIGGE